MIYQVVHSQMTFWRKQHSTKVASKSIFKKRLWFQFCAFQNFNKNFFSRQMQVLFKIVHFQMTIKWKRCSTNKQMIHESVKRFLTRFSVIWMNSGRETSDRNVWSFLYWACVPSKPWLLITAKGWLPAKWIICKDFFINFIHRLPAYQFCTWLPGPHCWRKYVKKVETRLSSLADRLALVL